MYHEAIMAAAKAATGAGRLDRPQGAGEAYNPLCGDRVRLDLNLDQSRVCEIRQEVWGCVLCEASASVVAAQASGQTREELSAVADAVLQMLKYGGATPSGAWEALAMFEPVADHRSRHECVLLPFEALLQALDRALDEP